MKVDPNSKILLSYIAIDANGKIIPRFWWTFVQIGLAAIVVMVQC